MRHLHATMAQPDFEMQQKTSEISLGLFMYLRAILHTWDEDIN
jgi:hypothetical protein